MQRQVWDNSAEEGAIKGLKSKYWVKTVSLKVSSK